MDTEKALIEGLGKVWTNLLAIEFAVRWYLCLHKDGTVPIKHRGVKDEQVPADPFSKPGYFSTVVREYNRSVTERGATLCEGTIIQLRNALAHGRLARDRESQYYRLVMYSKQKTHDKYTVEFSAVLSPEWFDEQVEFTSKEHGKVSQVTKQRWPDKGPSPVEVRY